MQRADQASKALLERDGGLGHLVIEERVAARLLQGLDASPDHRVARHRKGQLINDNAAQLLALHIDPLPEG